MSEKNMNDDFLREREDESAGIFNIQLVWASFCRNWYWVLFSAVICMGVAFLYLRYKTPVYAASMKVLIKDSGEKVRPFSGMALDEMGLLSSSNGFDNELEILGSTTVATRVAKKLKLYVSYFLEGDIKDVELYKNSPILVDMEEKDLHDLKNPVSLTLSKVSGSILVEGNFNSQAPTEASFRTKLKTLPIRVQSPYGTIVFQQNKLADTLRHKKLLQEWDNGAKIRVTICSPKTIGRMYSKGRLSTSPTSKTTTVASVSLTDTQRERALDYLSELLDCYNEDANEDKNEVARKTEDFIAERLSSIRKELDETEGSMELYKKSNELINLANDATNVLKSTTDYRKELIGIQTQIELLRSLMEYMDAPDNYLQIIPTNLGLGNSALITPLVSTIGQYNEMVLKRNRFLKGSSEDNPMVLQLTQQLSDMWPTIRQNMANIYDNMEVQKKSIERQYTLYSIRIQQTPTQERVLTNITRRQSLQSELYLTLLQKREENYIQLYSTAAKARIIEEPYILGKVSPKNNMVMLASLLFGICFPIGVSICRRLLRTRIETVDDVESLTTLPVLANIPLSKEIVGSDRTIVVKENRNDMMEEAFRGLRTNMNFVLKPGERVIMFTSCIPGEGKTFVASNLAMSMALLGKKVIVVGLDVRKPRLVQLFNLKSKKRGIVNFLCGDGKDISLLEEQIIPSGINANMDVLPAGVIPPNPAELLDSPLLKIAIEYLSSKYDYVILDTPPVGMVADSLVIGKLANVTMFVTRLQYSPKTTFRLLNDLSNKKLPNCNLVVNSVGTKHGRYGKYGYSYTYGSGKYGHYGLYGNYGQGEDKQFHVEK